jgi:Amiloride-sensitive sodium channel
MEPPYDTNCMEYDLVDITTPQSQASCIDLCIKNLYFNNCQCNPSHIFTRRDLAELRGERGVKYRLCDKNNPNDKKCYDMERRNSCAGSCRPDCISVYYNFEVYTADKPTDLQIKEAQNSELKIIFNYNQFYLIDFLGTANATLYFEREHKLWIEISRKAQGDLIYRYVPQVDINTLFGTVGGLASLWLGFSLLNIYHYLRNAISYCITNRDKLKESCGNCCRSREGGNMKRRGYESSSRSRDTSGQQMARRMRVSSTDENNERRRHNLMQNIDNNYPSNDRRMLAQHAGQDYLLPHQQNHYLRY